MWEDGSVGDVPVEETRRRIHSQGRKDRIRARDNVLLITSTLLLLLNKYSEILKGKATCFCPRRFFFSPLYVFVMLWRWLLHRLWLLKTRGGGGGYRESPEVFLRNSEAADSKIRNNKQVFSIAIFVWKEYQPAITYYGLERKNKKLKQSWTLNMWNIRKLVRQPVIASQWKVTNGRQGPFFVSGHFSGCHQNHFLVWATCPFSSKKYFSINCPPAKRGGCWCSAWWWRWWGCGASTPERSLQSSSWAQLKYCRSCMFVNLRCEPRRIFSIARNRIVHSLLTR